MDANGQRFWLLGDARHFPAVQHAGWHGNADGTCRALRLASERTLMPALSQGDAFMLAQGALESIPRAVDGIECVASWDVATSSVIASSYLPNVTLILALSVTPTDLCAGVDGVLYIAMPDGIRMHDLRGRWGDLTVTLAGFVPWRLTPAEGGGVWAMERTTGRLARLSGRPLRAQTPLAEDYDGRVFRPEPENGCAPQLTLLPAPVWGTNERPLALAALPGEEGTFSLAVLSWLDGDGTACLRRWMPAEQRLSAPLRLTGANYAYSFTWLSADRVAVRVPGRRDAPAFDLNTANPGGNVLPMGEIYPLSDAAQEGPFANGIVQPPHYPSGTVRTEPLYALSLNNLARRGEASNFADTPAGFSAWLIDSNDTTTVWNRIYAEALIPTHTGFVVWLAATNVPRPPAAGDLTAWHAHGFGRDIAELDEAMLAPHVPRAVWEPHASELPGHAGLLAVAQEQDTSGLFSVLVQNSRQRVRQITGRYLWVHIVMHGDGRLGPEIAALRAWGSRFSYADKYLPRIYRESLFGDAAVAPGEELARIDIAFMAGLDAGGELSAALRARLLLAQIQPGPAAQIVVEKAGAAWLLRDGSRAWRVTHEQNAIVIYRPQASGADFTARMLSSFEGVLTQMEDRVAAAHLLSDPGSVPEENLDWLAGWIGVAFDAALPAARRRDWLRAAPDLARAHGTRDGLRLALDIATGGGVRGGEIVVIEDFRLRRILATLLGVDMSEENDPLLPGLIESGNSIVGDTLFVGEHEKAELMALYNDAATTPKEDEATIAFYEKLAFRATVLVHREVEQQDFALIRRIVQLEAPAHVEVRVLAATWPLLVGVSSLVGVDTYLGPPRLPRPVQVNRSSLGMGDFLIGPAVLDPRLSGAPFVASNEPPVAEASAPPVVQGGTSFILDASASRATTGREIGEYRWRRLPPGEPEPDDA